MGLGLLLAAGYALQTAGLERTTVSNAGFITGLYVVFTPLAAVAALPRPHRGAVWAGVALSTAGLALLSGVGAATASETCSCWPAPRRTRSRSC